MPMYLGPDGQLYNRPVRGGTLLDAGNVPSPPRPRNPHGTIPAPPPEEAGFLRKTLFWLTALGGSGGMAYAMGNILRTHILSENGLDGFLGNISGILTTASPALMCVIALVVCLGFGIGIGEDNNYNLFGLILTLLSTGGVCLLFAVGLALLPYALALVGYLLIFGIVVGVIASLFGG